MNMFDRLVASIMECRCDGWEKMDLSAQVGIMQVAWENISDEWWFHSIYYLFFYSLSLSLYIYIYIYTHTYIHRDFSKSPDSKSKTYFIGAYTQTGIRFLLMYQPGPSVPYPILWLKKVVSWSSCCGAVVNESDQEP